LHILITSSKDDGHKISSARVATGKRFLAGDRSCPSTFESCHQNEAQLAAYVGYKDIASFRTFLLSPSFLKYYLLFDADWSKGMRSVGAFEWIRDVWLRENIRSTFSTSWDDVNRYKPSSPRDETYGRLSVEAREQIDQYLAQILILMVEEYTQAAPIVVIKEQQDTFSEKLIQLKPKVSTVPDISGRLVHLPQMKCDPPAGHEAQESDLEAYNRALNLLRHMSHATNNAWISCSEKDIWDRSNAIDTSHVPDFMRYNPIVEAPKHTVAEALKAQNMPEKKILLSWSTLKRDNEVREYLRNNEDLPLPPVKGLLGLGNPRILNEPQYRDSIRVQYRCHENGLQFFAVTMRFPPSKHDDEGEEFDVFSSEWDEVYKALQKKYADGNEVHVRIKLCLLDKESDERLMESHTSLREMEELLGL
jgi:hypothetical protein